MLIDNGTYILVLNGATMTVYRNLGKALHVDLELVEQKEQFTPETSELGRDRPGRSFSRVGDHRSGYKNTDLHSQEEEQFIKESVARLDALATAEQKPAIILAPPEALGIARKHYRPALQKLITKEIDRDYSTHPAKEVAAFLADY
ncbi:host attachment family protein [Parasphingorhabdus sp. JC815]|uniref:host attachment family protein n=1 Tax=Parasphingorhabdus sp. JC815 TaxID=3232140 RepID=UPI00345ADFD9